ncbi:MAG: Uncharacterized protein G01um101433_338 [Parcubacteria group bacterium Gr01-1014_33]|nr:MAG: Uncharacterized protein G01um101433_338 [Parcubacteria group bacterium Gr01-1014_33]
MSSFFKKIGYARKKILKLSYHAYYYTTRFAWPVWYYVRNRKPRIFWKNSYYELNNIQKEIMAALKRDGIAVVPLERLLSDKKIFTDIQSFTFKKLESLSVQARIQEQKKFLAEKEKELEGYNENVVLKKLEKASRQGGERKDFFISLWGHSDSTAIDLTNPFMRMALSDVVLGIINSYMGMCTRFAYYNLALTIPVSKKFPNYFSQRWHRDPDDIKLVKVFLYINDVSNEKRGPFCYIAGSQYGGRWRHVASQSFPKGSYPKPGEVEKTISASDIRVCTGTAGTLIFCDTSGLHKGGHCLEGERLMFTGAFLSEASLVEGHSQTFERSKNYPLPQYIRYALTPKK